MPLLKDPPAPEIVNNMDLGAVGKPPPGPQARDQELEVRFFTTKRLHTHVNAETGVQTPSIVEVPAVEIKFPADPTKVVCEEVTENSPYPRRFPHAWAMFMSGGDQSVGTKLEDLQIFNPVELANLQISGYKTLEQLIGAPFMAMARMGPGAHEWQQRAIRWKQNQQSGETLQAQIASQNSEIADLKKQLAAVLAAQGKPKAA